MPGVPGAGGPPPKRSDQRRRANKPDGGITRAPGATEVPVAPESDPDWHPVARRWFDSLEGSGQSTFYEPSDWATAWVIAESMSREFKPQAIVIAGQDSRIEYELVPPKGASLGAWLKAMTSLMVTEGDRRRARLELQRVQPDIDAVDEVEDELARRRPRASKPA